MRRQATSRAGILLVRLARLLVGQDVEGRRHVPYVERYENEEVCIALRIHHDWPALDFAFALAKLPRFHFNRFCLTAQHHHNVMARGAFRTDIGCQ